MLLLTFSKLFLTVHTTRVFVFVTRIFLLFSLSFFHCPVSYKSSSEIPTPTCALQILLFVKQATGISGESGVGRETRKKGVKPVVPASSYTQKRLIPSLLY